MSIATATDAEIVAFFLQHEIELESDHRSEPVQTVEDCHRALREQLAWAICDEEAIIENEVEDHPDADPDVLAGAYFAALRWPEVATQRGQAWFITRHRAAELLGTTVEAEIEEIEPGIFGEVLAGHELLLSRLLRAVGNDPHLVDHETPLSIAEWTRANAHRIYPAMRERGWDDDGVVREALFELASRVLEIPYQWFYDAWISGAAE